MGYPEWLKKRFKNGREIPDPTPVAMPANYGRKPLSLQEMLQRVREADSFMREQGAETLEDAEDFDLEANDPHSPWEENFDLSLPDHVSEEWRAREQDKVKKKYSKKVEEDDDRKYKAERRKRFWSHKKKEKTED